MLRSKVLLLLLVLSFLPLAAIHAAPPPPCTCELCLADPGVKCDWKVNGSCVHLLRTGVCLGQITGLAAAPVSAVAAPVAESAVAEEQAAPSVESLEPAPACGVEVSPSPAADAVCLECKSDSQCRLLCVSGVGRCTRTGCCMCAIL